MDVVELVNKYGFPIVMAVGMGFIIKYVWEWSTKEVKPVLSETIEYERVEAEKAINEIKKPDDSKPRIKRRDDMDPDDVKTAAAGES